LFPYEKARFKQLNGNVARGIMFGRNKRDFGLNSHVNPRMKKILKLINIKNIIDEWKGLIE
jgi:hypothetical protein